MAFCCCCYGTCVGLSLSNSTRWLQQAIQVLTIKTKIKMKYRAVAVLTESTISFHVLVTRVDATPNALKPTVGYLMCSQRIILNANYYYSLHSTLMLERHLSVFSEFLTKCHTITRRKKNDENFIRVILLRSDFSLRYTYTSIYGNDSNGTHFHYTHDNLYENLCVDKIIYYFFCIIFCHR